MLNSLGQWGRKKRVTSSQEFSFFFPTQFSDSKMSFNSKRIFLSSSLNIGSNTSTGLWNFLLKFKRRASWYWDVLLEEILPIPKQTILVIFLLTLSKELLNKLRRFLKKSEVWISSVAFTIFLTNMTSNMRCNETAKKNNSSNNLPYLRRQINLRSVFDVDLLTWSYSGRLGSFSFRYGHKSVTICKSDQIIDLSSLNSTEWKAYQIIAYH